MSKNTVNDLLPEEDDFKSAKEKVCCCGVGFDVVTIFLHAILLGIDYTIILSASSQYFTHLLEGDPEDDPFLDESATVSPFADTTLFTNDTSFCDPSSSEGDTLYAEQQTYWALAQLVGCVAGIFLPKLVNYKISFLIFTFLIFTGNMMYAVSSAQLLDNWRLAMSGRIICGLGDGSIVLGLSYIPLKVKDIPAMRTALVNYRMFVACGTTVGSIIAIGASTFSDPYVAEVDADFSFNPANFAGFLMGFLAFVVFILEAIVVAPFKPPTKKGAVCSPHWSWKILAWLFFVFTYGMLMGAVQYAAAIYCFISSDADELETVQASFLAASFFFALLGALSSSIITGKGCAKKLPKNVNLQLVQYLTLVIIIGLSFIYGAERLQGSPSDLPTSAMMVVGNLIFFYSVTSLSAAKTPLFKKIVPKSAISATMPLYKIMLDIGKAVGPYWTEASMAAETIDTAFAPYLALFCLISVFLFSRGTWMTTPDKEEEAFCYKGKGEERLVSGVGEFDSAAGGGQARKKANAAVTRGYDNIDPEEEQDEQVFVQLTDRKTDPAERLPATGYEEL